MEQKEDRIEIVPPKNEDEFQELIQTLDQHHRTNWHLLLKYQGFWCPAKFLSQKLSARKYFQAQNSDVILSSLPKSGTTWLKALAFCIVNRSIFSMDQNPLVNSNPHKLVPFIEFDLDWNKHVPPDSCQSQRRLLSTHFPFQHLPESILNSNCKIIYICRNPLDMFVSTHFFVVENFFLEKGKKPIELEEDFDTFCSGCHAQGPFWDNMLGYWNAHLSYPERVLFLKYEDLKEDTTSYVKRIAEFIGQPFSVEEEKEGLVEKISNLCSFENLTNLEVNKTGADNVRGLPMKNNAFFRKGQVGDWKNYLSPTMGERMKKIMENKFQGTGLSFKI